ncbi:MAG: hypothetical protein OXE17_01925 [Chloroflexi bacterium]|nr:hypothetical protein [Chloroflexota bacterium]
MSDLIGVSCTPTEMRVTPGEETLAFVEVQNLGRVVDAYAIDVEGSASSWLTLGQESVSLFPGDAESVGLTFHIPPGSEALAGTYWLNIAVSSSVFPGEETTVQHSIQVEQVRDYNARIRPELVAAPRGEYSISVTNSGNIDITLDLDGIDPEGLCRCAFNPNPLTVAPGESNDSRVLVHPRRRPIVEPARPYDLTINLNPRERGERISLNARLEASPFARKWYFPAALLVLLLMAWFSYSVYWLALERDDLTYLRQEKWDDFSETAAVKHGHIGSFNFEIASVRHGLIPSPPPIGLRGNVTWPDTGDVPPTLGVIVRDPEGNCWGPLLIDKTGDPFHFPVHDGGIPCPQLEYKWFLMDVSQPEEPIPAEYISGVPLTEYCVRDVEKNPVAKFFEDGSFQTPYRLSDDYSGPATSLAGLQALREQIWAIYVVNPHPEGQWPVAPEITINLKAVPQEAHSWKKDQTYSVERLELPLPQAVVPRVQCGWDIEMDIPQEDGGLEHGLIYVRRLNLLHRPPGDEAGGELGRDTGHYGCPREREDALELRLRTVCGDVTWERISTEEGNVTADNVFIILRHNTEEGARCWSRVELHSSPDSVGTPFTFDLVNGGRPCHEKLADPEQTLWNLMNWNTFEPARYQGVQPLVKFCPHESGQVLFDRHSAVPYWLSDSWEQNRTPGWTLYILNPSPDAAPPRVTVKLKGDQFWIAHLQELPNTTLGDTPLASAGSRNCPDPVQN